MRFAILVTLVSSVLIMFVGEMAIAEIVKTTDGRTIKLNDDGTYIFLNKNKTEKEYQAVDMNDLNLNAESWIEKQVKVVGFLKVFGTRVDSGLIGKTLSGTLNFKVDLASIPKATKRRLRLKCKNQCKVDLTGKFMTDGSLDYKIKVHDVIIR